MRTKPHCHARHNTKILSKKMRTCVHSPPTPRESRRARHIRRTPSYAQSTHSAEGRLGEASVGGRPMSAVWLWCRHKKIQYFLSYSLTAARRIELEMPTVKVRKEFSIEFFTSLLRGPANKYCDCRRPLSLEFDVASRHKKSIKRNKSRDYDQEEIAFVPRLYIFWIIDLKDDKKKKRDIIWSCIV